MRGCIEEKDILTEKYSTSVERVSKRDNILVSSYFSTLISSKIHGLVGMISYSLLKI